MMRAFSLFILIFAGLISAQDSSGISSKFYPIIIDSIKITGNEITEDFIIKRELNFKVGDSLYYKDLQFNRDRIFSLGIFNRVDLYFEEADGKNSLVIDIEESWYIYPIPLIELKDKSWDKISYGFYLVVKNFRGRNETIGLTCAFGYDPSFSLNYTIPSLTDDGNYYLYSDLYYREIKNKSQYALSLAGVSFTQKIMYGTVGFGRRFGLFNRVSVALGYTVVENPFFISGISASDERIDRFPSLGINYIYDTRDLVQFPTNGMYLNSTVNFKGLGVNDINYQILSMDYRAYLPIIGDLIAKGRVAGRFGFGNLVPTHDYSYIGFGERIRGFYAEEMEGNHLYIASAEIFYPIIKEFQINLDFIPILPKELLHYRAGLYVQLFTDSGTAISNQERISFEDFKSGYGAGITFLILPYNILRLEYAASESGATQWIFDLGISF